MTPKERAAMQQALEALEMAVSETLDYIQKNHLCGAENNHWIVQSKKAITALREALAGVDMSPTEQTNMNLNCKSVQARLATSWGYVKAEPVNTRSSSEYSEVKQEPVAWFVQYKNRHEFVFGKPEFIVDGVVEPLYTAPQPVKEVSSVQGTQELTDDEIKKVWNKKREVFSFARAVIAADREKNRGTA